MARRRQVLTCNHRTRPSDYIDHHHQPSHPESSTRTITIGTKQTTSVNSVKWTIKPNALTHFFMSIHRSAFPIVCDSSCTLYVAADKSWSAPFSYRLSSSMGWLQHRRQTDKARAKCGGTKKSQGPKFCGSMISKARSAHNNKEACSLSGFLVSTEPYWITE